MFCSPSWVFLCVPNNELASDILSAGSLVFSLFLLLFLRFLFLSPELSAAMRTDDERIRSAAAVHMQVFICVCPHTPTHVSAYSHTCVRILMPCAPTTRPSTAHPRRMRIAAHEAFSY